MMTDSLREQIKTAIASAQQACPCREPIPSDCECAIGADAALAAIEASGNVIVPLEPTEAMLAAIDTENDRLPITVEETWNLYRSMLAARPRDVSPTESK